MTRVHPLVATVSASVFALALAGPAHADGSPPTVDVAASLAANVAALAATPAPETATLDNGFQIVVIPDRRAPVVTSMVWYRVGAADEPDGKSGIAHLFEHLMFMATDERGAGEFSKTVARNGGQDNAFTAQDYTAYFQRIAADRLDLVLAMEADRMVDLQLTEKVVASEKDVVLEERNSRVDNDPAALFGEQLAAAQFLASPYGTPIIGWRREIEALNIEDARAFYAAHYAPDQAILVVAGDVSMADVLPIAEARFGPLKPSGARLNERPQEPPQLAARRLEMVDPRVQAPQFRRSWLAPTYGSGDVKQAAALDVLAEVLGGGSTGRLYRRLVVENTAAASVGAWYSGNSRDVDRFTIYVVPNADGDVAGAEAALDAAIAELLESGVTDEEVARAKNSLVASNIYALDSQSTMARIYGAALATGFTVEDVRRWPADIAGVTADEVTAAARAVLKPETSVTGILRPAPAS